MLTGEIYLDDRKTKTCSRTVRLAPSLCEELLPLTERGADREPVSGITYQGVNRLGKAARERAGLDGKDSSPRIWIKDLRAQFAIAAEEAGLPQTVVVRGMGHDEERMTRRYQSRRAALTPGPRRGADVARAGRQCSGGATGVRVITPEAALGASI